MFPIYPFTHSTTGLPTMKAASPAFDILVADHIEQKLARRLEHAINSAKDFSALKHLDGLTEELREQERDALLPIYLLFVSYVGKKKGRLLFALSLQRIEQAELNAVETKEKKRDFDFYDGNAVEAELESIYKAYEIADEPQYRETKFDTILPSHFDPSKTWIMKNTTAFRVQQYLNKHKLPGSDPIYFEEPTERYPKGRFMNRNSFNVKTVKSDKRGKAASKFHPTQLELIRADYEQADKELKDWTPLGDGRIEDAEIRVASAYRVKIVDRDMIYCTYAPLTLR